MERGAPVAKKGAERRARFELARAVQGLEQCLGRELSFDVQGTSPKGRRYGKEEAITTDTKSLSRDCQLGEVKVRFFGDSIAIAYGAESSMIKDNNGKETKSCLVWTDTWLKRAGKWQIVAAQDTIVPCNP